MSFLMQVFKAVASSMIGVGKKKNLVQDFEAVEKKAHGLSLSLAFS